jgi:pyruvate/2-oxoglutarate/acetoin dehydrogenase E1 component
MDIILMSLYLNKICLAMKKISRIKNTIFLGQSVKYSGNSIYSSLKDVPLKKRIELPVFEEVQMGMSIGLALQGFIPITCFPRFDFLILALNQLVNHADKIDHLTNNQFKSKIIIRTLVGSKYPLDAGPQHTQDHTEALKKLLVNTRIIKITKNSDVLKNYLAPFKDNKHKIFLFVEDGNNYV